MSIFKEVVEDRIEDPTGRLIRLIKYTDGEAMKAHKALCSTTNTIWIPVCKDVTRKVVWRSTQLLIAIGMHLAERK